MESSIVTPGESQLDFPQSLFEPWGGESALQSCNSTRDCYGVDVVDVSHLSCGRFVSATEPGKLLQYCICKIGHGIRCEKMQPQLWWLIVYFWVVFPFILWFFFLSCRGLVVVRRTKHRFEKRAVNIALIAFSALGLPFALDLTYIVLVTVEPSPQYGRRILQVFVAVYSLAPFLVIFIAEWTKIFTIGFNFSGEPSKVQKWINFVRVPLCILFLAGIIFQFYLNLSNQYFLYILWLSIVNIAAILISQIYFVSLILKAVASRREIKKRKLSQGFTPLVSNSRSTAAKDDEEYSMFIATSRLNLHSESCNTDDYKAPVMQHTPNHHLSGVGNSGGSDMDSRSGEQDSFRVSSPNSIERSSESAVTGEEVGVANEATLSQSLEDSEIRPELNNPVNSSESLDSFHQTTSNSQDQQQQFDRLSVAEDDSSVVDEYPRALGSESDSQSNHTILAFVPPTVAERFLTMSIKLATLVSLAIVLHIGIQIAVIANSFSTPAPTAESYAHTRAVSSVLVAVLFTTKVFLHSMLLMLLLSMGEMTREVPASPLTYLREYWQPKSSKTKESWYDVYSGSQLRHQTKSNASTVYLKSRKTMAAPPQVDESNSPEQLVVT